LLDKQAETLQDASKILILLRGGIGVENLENQSFTRSVFLFFNQHLALVVLIWFIGVAFFALRLMGGLMYIEILKTRHVTPLTHEWQARMNMFKNRLGIKETIALMESALVGVPMTIGWLRPIILLPIGTINGMTVAQVEAILAHELSHIQAKDYILNIFQTLIEILFYYHPAVWWISANIRAERENRCDDVAVKLCSNSLTYAKALLALQEMQHQNIRTYGLAMTFSTKRKGILLKRVKRILNQPQNRSNIMEKLASTGCYWSLSSHWPLLTNPTIRIQRLNTKQKN
jgi:bla regulator protein blaR1